MKKTHQNQWGGTCISFASGRQKAGCRGLSSRPPEALNASCVPIGSRIGCRRHGNPPYFLPCRNGRPFSQFSVRPATVSTREAKRSCGSRIRREARLCRPVKCSVPNFTIHDRTYVRLHPISAITVSQKFCSQKWQGKILKLRSIFDPLPGDTEIRSTNSEIRNNLKTTMSKIERVHCLFVQPDFRSIVLTVPVSCLKNCFTKSRQPPPPILPHQGGGKFFHSQCFPSPRGRGKGRGNMRWRMRTNRECTQSKTNSNQVTFFCFGHSYFDH